MFTEDWNASQFWVNASILHEMSHLDALSTVMRRPSFLLSSSSKALRKTLESHLSPLRASSFSLRTYWYGAAMICVQPESVLTNSQRGPRLNMRKSAYSNSTNDSECSKNSSITISNHRPNCQVREAGHNCVELILTHSHPGDLKGAYDRILCDPPFLSADCQTKGASLVRSDWIYMTDGLVSDSSRAHGTMALKDGC